MYVYLITEEQVQLLANKEYVADNYFNPIQDFNNNWIISQQEVDMCNTNDLLWIKDLLLIEYVPKIEEEN